MDVPGADAEPAERVTDLPSLSVIIPTHNRAMLLREQLDALAKERYPGWWELLVVDNRSSDNIAFVVADYERLLPISLLTATAHQSRAHAVNVGSMQAHGEALLWLDNDDVIAPGYLTAMGAALRRSPFVGARLDTQALNSAWTRGRRRPVQETELPTLLSHLPFVVGAAFGVHRAAFTRVGGCDEDLLCLEDVDLSWRLQDAGFTPRFVPDAVLHYRYRQTLLDIVRQEHAYGRWEAALYAKHPRLAERPLRARTTAADLVHVLRTIPHATTSAGQARLATAVGASVGRLRGSLLPPLRLRPGLADAGVGGRSSPDPRSGD